MDRLILVTLACLTALYAGDVQVDTNGNLIVDTGTVRAANVLQLPLPTSTTTLGDATILDATAFGKWYLVGGTGNYEITLPAAANNAGKCIGFRVLDAALASKTYTLKPATTSEKIDGAATQALTASGSLVIMSDGSHWARVGGTSTGSGGAGGSSTAALTDWQDGGPITFTGTTTNPTKGTAPRDKVRWRRVGDSAEIVYAYEQITAGSDGSGNMLLSLPAGLVADQTKCSTDPVLGVGDIRGFVVGNGMVCVPGGTSKMVASAVLYDVTHIRLQGVGTTGSLLADTWRSGIIGFGNVGLQVSAVVVIPIQGWSGTTAVQQGSRYLWAQRYGTSSTRVTSQPNQPGQYRALRAGVDTAPASTPSAADGFRIDSGSGIAANRANQYQVYVGPGKVVQVNFFTSPARTGWLVTDLHINGGVWNGTAWSYDPTTGVVIVNTSMANAGDLVGKSPAYDTVVSYATGYFDILVADDPVPVATAPSVHVEASSDAGQACTSLVTDLQYEDKQIDTHGAWNGSVFTAPVAGIYFFSFNVHLSANTADALVIYLNGAQYLAGVSAANDRLSLSGTIQLAAGDTLRLRGFNNRTRSTNAVGNHMSITRVGN